MMLRIFKKTKMMILHIFKVIFLLGMVYSSQFSFAKNMSNFEGLWQEITLYDDSDIVENEDNGISVDDEDYYWISEYNDKLLINSVVSPYFSVSQIEQKNNILKFTIINSEDLNDIYILKYTCRELKINKELKCEFINQKGEIEKNIFGEKEQVL